MFETKSLAFASAVDADIESIMRIENDPENRNFVWQGTREEHQAEILDPEIYLLVARKKGSEPIVGHVLLHVDNHSEVLEFRRMAITEKGRGYGWETCSGVLRFAFETLRMNRVWLDVYPDNAVGISLYEKLGMHLDGELRQSYKSERGFLNQRVYSMLKSEYATLKDRLR